MRDSRSRTRNFPGHEILSAPRRLMVVKNAVTNKEAIGLPVNTGHLRGKGFRAAVRAGRPDRSLFRLRRLLDVAENFRARSIIKAERPRLIACDLQQSQCRHGNFFGSRFRNFETQSDVALSCEV